MLTNDADHAQFQFVVSEFLQSEGFLTPAQITYHEAWSGSDLKAKEILQNRFSRTALNLRTRADRIAIHGELECEFEWEVKTKPARSAYDDLTCEALPLCFHILKSRLGVRCLYAVRHCRTGREFSFWADDEFAKAVKSVKVPMRWSHIDIANYCADFHALFPNAAVNTMPRTNGSDDPFILVAAADTLTLPDWKDSIRKAKVELLTDAAKRMRLGPFKTEDRCKSPTTKAPSPSSRGNENWNRSTI